MNSRVLNALTRRAAEMTRGAAGLTVANASPMTASAKKKQGKNNGKKGDATKLCKKQVGQCLDFFTPSCADNPECLALIDRCCPSLGSCDFDGFFECVSATAM